MLHTLRFSLQNAVYFIMLTFSFPVLFAFYTQGVLKFNVKLRCQKVKQKNYNIPVVLRATHVLCHCCKH
jgi:hypothetical protein